MTDFEKEVRDVLNKEFSIYYAITGGGTYSSYHIVFYRALSAIQTAVLKALPKNNATGQGSEFNRGWFEGFNAAISEMEQRIKGR